MAKIRGKIKRHHRDPDGSPGSGADSGAGTPQTQTVEISTAEMEGIFTVPDWLKNIGFMSWLLLGIGLVVVGLVWLASLTQVIVVPFLVASIIATVGSPLVAKLKSWGLPRGIGALLVMLFIVVVAIGMGAMITAGIISESTSIGHQLSSAKDEIGNWLGSLGLDSSQKDSAKQTLDSGASNAVNGLLQGLIGGISAFAGIAFFLSMAALSLFFLLKDGPTIRAWTESHSGLPGPVSRVISQRAIGSLRGYFLGTTIVAAFSAAVVGLGSFLLGLPLIGTIVAVTFIAGYIPYLGAWSAGAFTVLLALGSSGPEAAAGMVVLQVLANGVLQQLVQPFAMGTALGIHPLAVLLVTISGGALFGTMGLILAAPLVSAIVRISADLKAAREAAERDEANHDDAAREVSGAASDSGEPPGGIAGGPQPAPG